MRLALSIIALVLSACDAKAPPVLGGDPENGKLLLRQFGCGACHTIPGVAAADGRVGPPLERIAGQIYIAGVVPNTPEQMLDFIRAPQKADPRTAMPEVGVSEAHARDMVAYLYTLK
jgi:cytochrome c